MKSRRKLLARSVVGIREKRYKYRIFIGKPVTRFSLETSRRRLEDNIKIYLRRIGCEEGKWVIPTQDRV
jgi:hypothetical protein